MTSRDLAPQPLRTTGSARHRGRPLDPRTTVPAITPMFWVVKILTTGMGETTSDFGFHSFNPFLVVTAGGIAFVGAMAWQLSRHRYVVGVYWLAVVMVSVFGTMVADGLHVELGIPYLASTVFFACLLGVVFGWWYRTESTVSIHRIDTPRRERFYWATVLTTFALGTAVGDLCATTLHLGYFGSGVLFAALIAVPALGNARFGLPPVLAFWTAYVLTRPLGASFADWMGISHARGGLGWGTGPVSAALAVLIAGVVLTLARRSR